MHLRQQRLAKKTILLTVISASSLLEMCFFTAPEGEQFLNCRPKPAARFSEDIYYLSPATRAPSCQRAGSKSTP